LQIIVQAEVAGYCTGKKIYITKGSDNGKYIDGKTFNYSPGDTLVLTAAQNPYSYLSLEGFHGTATCPITIINEGGQVTMTNGVGLSNCTYVNIQGTGGGMKYGFYIESPLSNGVGIEISGRSANIVVRNIDIYHKTYGFWVKQEASCADSLQFPNWYIDNISIHDNRIRKTGQEGMYLGSTDPNGTRSITCNGKVITPKPLRLSNIKVYNNIIDSTNRSGIQLSCASKGNNQIYNNVVTNCGFEFATNQGNGISLGGYSHANVHDNTVTNTYALGIFSLGSGDITIANNKVSGSGQLGGKTVNGMDAILVDTRYTSPVDSSLLHITGNTTSNYTGYGIRFIKPMIPIKKEMKSATM